MAEKELSKQGSTKYFGTKIARHAARALNKIAWEGQKKLRWEKELNKNEVKRVLFIQLYGIGDYLMSTPAITCILEEFPKAMKIVLCKPHSIDLAKNTPKINKAITIKELKEEKPFDLVVSLNDSAEASMIALKIKSKYIIGFLKGKKVEANFKIKDEVANEKNSWVENYLLIPKSLGITVPKDVNYELIIKKSNKIDALLKANELKSFIVVNPNTREGAEAKNWGNENYAKLLPELIKLGHKVVLCGANGEKNSSLVAELAKKSMLEKESGKKGGKSRNYAKLKNYDELKKYDKFIVDLTGKTSLIETANLFSKAKLFIGNDTGPMHIALAAKCPTIGIFGPTSAKILFPNKKNSFAFQVKNNEWPCYTKGTFDVLPNQEFMDQITPKMVIRKTKELLK